MPGRLVPSETNQRTSFKDQKQKTTSTWTFNFRQGFESDTDSSDEESSAAIDATIHDGLTIVRADGNGATNLEGTVNPVVESEDARLLRELDIASRAGADTVKFTMTPWTIARENAALRGPASKDSAVTADKRKHVTERYNTLGKEGAVFNKVQPTATMSKDPTPLEGLKKVRATPKLGKNIEKFFAARKPDSSSSQFKHLTYKPKAPRHSSNVTTDSLAHLDQQAPSRPPPGLPGFSSNSSRSSAQRLNRNHYVLPNDTKPDLRMRPTSTDENAVQSIRLTLGENPAANQALSLAMPDSDNIEVPDSSSSTLCADEFGPFMGDFPCPNSKCYTLQPPYVSCINQSSHLQEPCIYAGKKDFKDDHTPCLSSSDKTQPKPKDDLDSDLQNMDLVSSPLFTGYCKAEALSQAPWPENLTDHRRAAGPLPHVSSTGLPLSTTPRTRTSQGPQGSYGSKYPAYMRSLSSPTKQPNLLHPGRASCGLESSDVQDSSDWNYPIFPEHARSSIDIHAYTQAFASSDNPTCDLQNNLCDQWHPKEEDLEYELPKADPQFAFVQSELRTTSDRPRSALALNHLGRDSPFQAQNLPRYLQSIERSRHPTSRPADIYAAYADDNEDANWSTLPQRSKARIHGSSSSVRSIPSIKQSGRFKLPIALASLAAKSVSNEPTSTGKKKKRVITYLPPPRDPPPQSSPMKRRNSGARVPVTQMVVSAPKRKDSEHRSAVKDEKLVRPASQWAVKRFSYGHGDATRDKGDGKRMKLHSETPMTKTEQTEDDSCFLKQEQVQDSARIEEMPSTDETDATLCNSFYDKDLGRDFCDDISFSFNIEAVERSYPYVRKELLERKAAANGVWDELGLPSCGVPFADPDPTTFSNEVAEVDRKQEIAIVVWTGKPEEHFGIV